MSLNGMLTFYLLNRILIYVPEKDNDAFKETERLDKEMIERWLGEADSVIIFVSAGSTILCILPYEEHAPRLRCSRLSAQSPLLKATSGYLPITAIRQSIYSMQPST
jgi:hypothetical protein